MRTPSDAALARRQHVHCPRQYCPSRHANQMRAPPSPSARAAARKCGLDRAVVSGRAARGPAMASSIGAVSSAVRVIGVIRDMLQSVLRVFLRHDAEPLLEADRPLQAAGSRRAAAIVAAAIERQDRRRRAAADPPLDPRRCGRRARRCGCGRTAAPGSRHCSPNSDRRLPGHDRARLFRRPPPRHRCRHMALEDQRPQRGVTFRRYATESLPPAERRPVPSGSPRVAAASLSCAACIACSAATVMKAFNTSSLVNTMTFAASNSTRRPCVRRMIAATRRRRRRKSLGA